MTSFRQPSSSVTVNGGSGLTWSLSGASIHVHGDWRIRWIIFFSIPIHDHGNFDASATGASVSVSVTLGKTATGEPTIRSTGCTSHVNRVRIRLHGGASWLYNLFMGHVERPLRDDLKRKICEGARKAIDTNGASELATLPVTVPIGDDKQWLLDYRLVSSPAFASSYLESFHKGEFFEAENSTEAPFQPSPLPSPPTTDRMVTIWVSGHVLNTTGFVLHKQNMLRYYLTKEGLPEKFRKRLNTTCSSMDYCIGFLFPPVGRKFPDASVEIEMFSSAFPVARINPQHLIGKFVGVTVFRARLSNGSLAHLFTMNVTAEVKVVPRLDGTVLKAKVLSMENTFTVIDSSVGEISTGVVRLVFNVIKESFIMPKLNETGEKGLLLPTVKHVRFVNSGLQLENECVRAFTDVRAI